jgi:hypothetical protein
MFPYHDENETQCPAIVTGMVIGLNVLSWFVIQRVLVLRIRGASVTGDHEFKPNRGWLYQVFAPISTLLRVRGTGQLSHSEIELHLLIDKWRGKVQIVPVTFEFDGANPPLSWHLTEAEKDAIEQNWKAELNGSKKQEGSDKSGLDMVREFLGQAR